MSEMEAIIDDTIIQNKAERAQKTWATSVLPLRGYVHPEGVMIGEHSGLVLVTRLSALPLDGLGKALAEAHARASASTFGSIGRGSSAQWRVCQRTRGRWSRS